MAGGICAGRLKPHLVPGIRASHILGVYLLSFVTFTSAEQPNWGVCAPSKPFAKADVWGTGLQRIKVRERECFLVKPLDGDGKELDKQCSPASTFWVAFLHSQEGSIRVFGDAFHLPKDGYHQVCYWVMDPGNYTVSLYLVGTNYSQTLVSRNTTAEDYPYIKVHETTVEAKVENETEHAEHMANLPTCTQQILTESGNIGRWIGNLWHPNACKVNRITPKEALECLDGKRVLLTGDSQMWAMYAELMNFMGKGDRCKYLEQYDKEPLAMASLRAYKARAKGAVPYVPGTEDIAVHTTEFGDKAMVTYYGTAGNGFGVGRVHDTAASPGASRRAGSRGKTVLISYVSHSDSGKPLYRPWMIDYERTGLLANALAPFDLVLGTSGLHDMALYDTADEFAHNLDKEFLPSLRFFVRNISTITWVGLWAAQEDAKARRLLRFRNNARGFAMEKAASRVAKAWKLGWLGMKYMTAARKDLCPDSAHYSWPVAIATLELWLGSICPPPEDTAPDSRRC